MARRGYSELYGAIQDAFDPEDMTRERLEEWMVHGEGSASPNTASLAEQLSETRDIVLEIPEYDISNIKELEELRSRANTLRVHRSSTITKIDNQLDVLNEEEEIIAQVQTFREEIENIRSLPIEEQKDLFKKGTTEERKLAAVALREDSPRVLGGMISGESRRVKRALSTIM